MLLPNVRDPRRGSPPSIQAAGWSSVRLPFACSCVIYSSFCLFPQRPDERISFFPPAPVCFQNNFPQISVAWPRNLEFLPELLCVLSFPAVSNYCSFGDLHTHWMLKGRFEEREVRLFAAELGCALGLYLLWYWLCLMRVSSDAMQLLPEKTILRSKLLVGFSFERAWISTSDNDKGSTWKGQLHHCPVLCL